MAIESEARREERDNICRGHMLKSLLSLDWVQGLTSCQYSCIKWLSGVLNTNNKVAD